MSCGYGVTRDDVHRAAKWVRENLGPHGVPPRPFYVLIIAQHMAAERQSKARRKGKS